MTTVRLEVRQQPHGCEFRMSWGEGQQFPPVLLPLPTLLMEVYQQWQGAYLNFYRSFRGRVVGIGHLSDVEDRRGQLVKTEADLLNEFHQWLRSPKLDDLRRQIAQLAKECSGSAGSPLGETPSAAAACLTLLLTCYPIELDRLPWEAWEIGQELGTLAPIRIARSPDQIRARPALTTRQGRNRVLVILGDDTGLDFRADREALRGLAAIADIHFMGWQPGQDPTALLTHITQAITDRRGWDVLLFAGHSNEAAASGGELAIAPNLTLTLHELAPALAIALQQGLQFALFNSCSGLNIAKSLIDLGFHQVAIMREPIHNRVAQAFLVQFLHRLAQYMDVHEALMAASQTLKLEKNLTFPSAALVPSLFCRPGQPWFHFRQFGWRAWLGQLRPTRPQALALAGLASLSVLLPVQGVLLEQRLWSQALYRRLTGQTTVGSPHPITLVQIDDASLVKAGISAPNPMDRAYLAALIDQIHQRQARVIGVDYLLDRPAAEAEDDQAIAAALQRSAAQGTWLVLASIPTPQGEWSPIVPTGNFASSVPHWSLPGDVLVRPPYFTLVNPWDDPVQRPLPFAYLLALAAELEGQAAPTVPRPNLQSTSPLITQGMKYLKAQGQNYTRVFSARSRYHMATILAYWVRQWWLQPMIDFSIPPDQVYQTVPAWQLLESSGTSPNINSHINSQPIVDNHLTVDHQPTADNPSTVDQPLDFAHHIVILAAGGYGEAGVLPGQDHWELPAAVRHWRFWQNDPGVSLQTLTGGEIHAYMLHHFLTRRLVVPIPDLWMIGVAALLGKGTALALQNRAITHRQRSLLLVGTTATYGIISLQIYVSAAILLPWLLPSVTFCLLVSPAARAK